MDNKEILNKWYNIDLYENKLMLEEVDGRLKTLSRIKIAELILTETLTAQYKKVYLMCYDQVKNEKYIYKRETNTIKTLEDLIDITYKKDSMYQDTDENFTNVIIEDIKANVLLNIKDENAKKIQENIINLKNKNDLIENINQNIKLK